MKKTQTTGFIIFCAASILFTGCTIQYVPTSQYLIEPEMVKEFRGDNKNIRIVNTQTKKDIIVLKKGPSTVNSDLTALTEVASEILTAELEKRGFGFSETSEKILSISVQNIGAEEGLVAVHCNIYLEAKTGDGYDKIYEGIDGSGVSIHRGCDAAIRMAVVNMLNDDRIVAYLTDQEAK